jgi:sulfite exporter TauE/SafE
MDQMKLWTIAAAGISLGLAGSFHCLGMCGPLIIAMHGGQRKQHRIHMLVHHMGRTLAYITLFLVFMLLGKSAHGMGWQQSLSILGGIVFVLGWIPKFQKWMGRLLFPIRNKIQNFIPLWPTAKNFLQGLTNGFLPCGWSISAIGAALVDGQWTTGILFMVFFAFGNTPILWLTALGGQKILKQWPWLNQKWARVSLMMIGLLFILRGSNLGIPYISPKMEKEKMSCCSTH